MAGQWQQRHQRLLLTYGRLVAAPGLRQDGCASDHIRGRWCLRMLQLRMKHISIPLRRKNRFPLLLFHSLLFSSFCSPFLSSGQGLQTAAEVCCVLGCLMYRVNIAGGGWCTAGTCTWQPETWHRGTARWWESQKSPNGPLHSPFPPNMWPALSCSQVITEGDSLQDVEGITRERYWPHTQGRHHTTPRRKVPPQN